MSENKTILDKLEDKCRTAMMEKAALSCYYKELHDPVPRDVSKGQALAFAIAMSWIQEARKES